MLKTDTIQITPELLALISEIDEFKGAWRALGTLAPKRLNALRRVAAIESIGSSTRIEGSKLSDREVERLLHPTSTSNHSRRVTSKKSPVTQKRWRTFLGVIRHKDHRKSRRQNHRDLLRYDEKDEWHRGEYKKNSNSVAAFDADGKQIGIVFQTATPFDTPRLMAELVAWLDDVRTMGRLHPLLIVAVLAVVFLEIHPFQDGNGRLSRILTTLLLLQLGYAYIPYSSLESIIEHSKEGYYLGSARLRAPSGARHPTGSRGSRIFFAPCISRSSAWPKRWSGKS